MGRKKSASKGGGIQPIHVFGFALGYLVLAWLISYFGDAHNFLSLQERLINRGRERPFMWYFLFMEGSPTEMLQWTYLVGTVLLCGYLSGQLWAKKYFPASRFFLLLGIGTSIMLMEDAGNLRHQIKYYVRLIFGDTMIIGMGTEIVFFSLLGVLMLYAFVKYWRYPWQSRKTRRYMIGGYLAYVVAVTASATRHFGDWYDHAGEWFLKVLGLLEPMNALFVPYSGGRPIGFYIMDFLVEESIELMGASALCAAILAYLREFEKNPGIAALKKGNAGQ